MVHRFVTVWALITLLLITLSGCGGGFKADNENSEIFEKSIFGPDTILE